MGNTKKLKDKDLAAAGMARCPVSGCERVYKPSEDQKAVPPRAAPVCPACSLFVIQLMYWLPKIKIEKQKTASGLILPGHEEFNTSIKEYEKMAP